MSATGSLYWAAAAAALALCWGAAGAQEAAGPGIAKTTYGLLQGESGEGVVAFLGVPYAGPTSGKARFLPPAKPKKWNGVRAAKTWGPRCPQPAIPVTAELASIILYSEAATDEDCLTLNVWTPAVDHKRRPVMVYFHGGGFAIGSSLDPYYEGNRLARNNDVVVVTINHRLGAFGYLALGASAGPAYADSGMAGNLDLVAALHWVHDNIAQFGGDGGNVTIFGQSGGGMKVSTVMGMPAAKGLFQKAIIMSGAAVKMRSKDEASEITEALLKEHGLSSKDIDKLQALPVETLVKMSFVAGFGPRSLGPAVDGKVLPHSPFDPAAAPLFADVPLLIGWTKDEAVNFSINDPSWPKTTDADLLTRVTQLTDDADLAKRAIAFYHEQNPKDTPPYLWTDIATDANMGYSHYRLAERKAAQPAPVYLYRLAWESPVLGGKLRAPHAMDLPFVFDNVKKAPGMIGSGPGLQPLANFISRSFAAFARTGDPTIAGGPKWPRYTPEQREEMVFDTTSVVKADPDQAKRLFWEQNTPPAGFQMRLPMLKQPADARPTH
jgi:para-nitrobenzyl esterase